MYLKYLNPVKVFLLICIILNAGCAGDQENRNPPETPSQNLNTLLNTAPISWIDLNETEIDTMVIPADNIYEEQMFVNESLYVVNPTHITTFGEHIIVNEFGKANVVALNKEGIPQRNISRKGRGPGEFERPYELMSDGEYLYINDDAQKRISVFDKEFELVEIFNFKDAAPGGFSDKIVMNKDFIAYENHYISNFHSEDPDGSLLWVRGKEDIDSVYFKAIPRIIPPGMQPSAYNNLLLSMNENNELLTAFSGLPFLFVFDQFEHAFTIGLEAVHYDTTDSPSLEPKQPDGNKGVGVKGLFGNLKMLENGDILFSSFGLVHHLKKEDGNGYTSKKSYFLKREDTGGPLIVQGMDAFPEEPDRFYVLGWRHMYRVDLPISE